MSTIKRDATKPQHLYLRAYYYQPDPKVAGYSSSAFLIGSAEGKVPPNSERPVAELLQWQTHNQYRKHGLGRLLLDLFMRIVHDFGFEYCKTHAQVLGGVDSPNSFFKLYSTYYSLGFRPTSELAKKAVSAELTLRLADYQTSLSLAVGHIGQVTAAKPLTIEVTLPIFLNARVTVVWPTKNAPEPGTTVKVFHHANDTWQVYRGGPKASSSVLKNVFSSSSRQG